MVRVMVCLLLGDRPIVVRARGRARACDDPGVEFPDLPLPLAGGGVLERDDLLGRSWVVYLTRHPG